MAKKSNKTSHVLNLLTKGNPVSEKENITKVTIVDESAGDALSESILEKLEAEIAEPEPEKEEPMATEESAAEPEPEKEVVIQEVKSPSFFNLMERLLERQDIEKYMSQYNVCKCPKCIADVKARTLTNLPAKYISSEGGFEEASMNFYENKYKIRMLTELIRACIAVRNNPRHDNN